ncbi:N-6 DNA methylase [Turicimonas muris]|uniref:N-6 DNA methylase n=1 Tax=Turicimonas muris TaxID=1796652 RepID=UPI0023F09A87|nr:N-6 DNA methylase [Turicimonas muris]
MAEKVKKVKKTKVAKELSLEDILWNCRDILRSKASLATRRDIILTLVFLKFVGEKRNQQRELISQEIRARNEKNKVIESKRPIPEEAFLEADFSYLKNGVFSLPTECRWETILNIESNQLALALDNIVAKLDREEKSLRGALPQKIFTDSRIEGKVLKALIDEINKISSEKFHEKDLIGRVYEYFLQAFSINADKEEGEFYTPHSIVELISALIEPYDGTIYDPCCGSGGMFIQAAKFVEAHGGRREHVTVFGQESQPETYRLAKMNLAVRGISANLGELPVSTFSSDQHRTLKADYIMANPPFNLKKWREKQELLSDVRWSGYGVPPVGNANYAWILHMLSHLEVTRGVAGFLLANGALGDEDSLEIRKKLIENDKIEAIIILPRQMFYSTDISVTLWILNQNKKGGIYHKRNLRNREGEILFVDLRTWNQNKYEKNFVQFSEDQIQKIVSIYQQWQQYGLDDSKEFAAPELYRSVSKKEIEENGYSLVPSRYIEFVDRDQDIDYQSIMKETSTKVSELLHRQAENQEALAKAFKELGYGE